MPLHLFTWLRWTHQSKSNKYHRKLYKRESFYLLCRNVYYSAENIKTFLDHFVCDCVLRKVLSAVFILFPMFIFLDQNNETMFFRNSVPLRRLPKIMVIFLTKAWEQKLCTSFTCNIKERLRKTIQWVNYSKVFIVYVYMANLSAFEPKKDILKYGPLHITLPKSSLQMYWISVRVLK